MNFGISKIEFDHDKTNTNTYIYPAFFPHIIKNDFSELLNIHIEYI